MDTYERLIERKTKLLSKQKDLEINMRLMYWKYIKSQELYKSNSKEIKNIIKRVQEVQTKTKEQIDSDIEQMNLIMQKK